MDKIQEANDYIQTAAQKVNGKYRPRYHMTAPVGWMNDPNGLVKFGGKYHLYYQYNPYDVKPGTMFWGHFVSEDLIRYENAGVAVAPDKEHTSVFSGCAIEKDGELVAVYTEHYEKDREKREEICSLRSPDGMVFSGKKKIFDNARLPAHISAEDFRDPGVVYRDGTYYCLVGGRDLKAKRGVVVVLQGESLDKLDYKFHIGPFKEFGTMCECPCLVRVGEKDVLLVSVCRLSRKGNNFKNVNSSLFVAGNVDFSRNAMKVDFIREIDKGDAFYAPQCIGGEEPPVMVAWSEMWGKRYPTAVHHHGWVGAFTLPRLLEWRDGDVFQRPVPALDAYCREETGKVLPECARLRFTIEEGGVLTVRGENGSVKVSMKKGYIRLDTRHAGNMNGCIRRTNRSYRRAGVELLWDVSGIELFVDGGRETITSRVYLDGCTLEGNEKICDLTVSRVEL